VHSKPLQGHLYHHTQASQHKAVFDNATGQAKQKKRSGLYGD